MISNYTLTTGLRSIEDTVGFCSVILIAASFLYSRALFNVLSFILILCCVFRIISNIREFFAGVPGELLIYLVIILFLAVAISSAYSIAPIGDTLSQVKSYAKILVLPLILVYLNTRERVKYFELVLIGSLSFLLISYFFMFLTRDFNGGIFTNYIVEGLAISILGFLFLDKALRAARQNLLLNALLFFLGWFLAFICVFFISAGRAAQLSFLAGTACLIFLGAPRRKAVLVTAAALVLVIAAATLSEIAVQRFTTAYNEAVNYKELSRMSSAGQRINAWITSLEIWKDAPLFGHGAGSYKHLLVSEYASQVGGCPSPVCDQPHNQYLLFAVEQGLIGFLLFVAILLILAKKGLQNSFPLSNFSISFAAAFALHSFFDSSIKIGAQAFIFVVFTALIVASSRIPRP